MYKLVTNISVFLYIVTSLVFSGCAQQIGDIDRTQPNKLEKEAFEGEWYMQQTVVGVNATAISSFVGLEGPTDRVLFEFEEDQIIAYRTHEDVFGSDSQALGENEVFDHGQPVAAYSVSHFDVQRSYNSSTGEQSNVLVENGSDRPWYERDYVRVDWTRNWITTSVDPMVEFVGISDLTITPQDEGDDPSWYVERDENDEVVYIDVLNTYVIEPDWVECALAFGIPNWNADCGPETIEVRTSFVKITEESDYISREYDDWDMNDFGWFQTHRNVYDSRYGATDSGRVYLANRFNIWERNTDNNGDPIPYAEREPTPIVYYMTNNFPDELKESMYEIAQDYDNAFRRIVATYRGLDVPNDPDLMYEVPFSDIPRMFYLCENPGGTESFWEISNEGYELGHCVNPGEPKNLGDIRYNLFAWVNHHQMASPLGYGPSSVDAVNGRTISARAYIYGDAVNTYSQYALNLSKAISGDIDIEDLAFGEVTQAYFDRLRQEMDGDLYYGQLEDRRDSMERLEVRITEHLDDSRVQAVLDLSPDSFAVQSIGQVHPLELLRDTELEGLALFPEVQDRMGLGQFVEDDSFIDDLSIANIGDPNTLLTESHLTLERFLTHGQDHDCVLTNEILDPSLIGLSKDLADERVALTAEGMTEAEIDEIQWNIIRNRLMRFVMAHEVGHNMGLMHNFSGSFDAMNYPQEYWNLRQETFSYCDPNAITFSNQGFYTGAVAPARCDDEERESVEEYDARSSELLDHLLEENIHSYQFSSVMDYTNRYYNNKPGLGRYDYAALAFGYGELREVFDEAPNMLHVEVYYDGETDDFSSSFIRQSDHKVTTFDDVDIYVLSRANDPGGDDPFYLDDERDQGLEHSNEFFHYSTLPIMFGGDMNAMYNRHLVPESEVGQSVVVPFRYCSDFYRGTRTECNVFDQGADFLEIYQDIEDVWNGYYYLNFFRRDRAGFGLWLYPIFSRMFSRTMAPMTNLYQHWLIRASGRGAEWYASDWGGYDATIAAYEAVDFLISQITMPTIGTYYFDEDEDMYMNLHEDMDYSAPYWQEVEENINPDEDYLNIAADFGRYGFEQFRRNEDDELGMFGFLEPEILSYFWAKWAAMMALVMPEVEIIGQDTSSDSTAFSIPIYLIFDEELTTFFGALPREDFEYLGNCVLTDDEGNITDIHQTTFVNTNPTECEDAPRLNPYTEVYGHSDFNMRLLSILYGAAYFQTNYDMNWFDLSNIYIAGRGYTPEPADGYVFETFEDDGLVYVAMMPDVLEEDENEDIYVGVQLIRQANEYAAIAADIEAADGTTSDYWDYYWRTQNVIESMRLINQANEIFEGFNVFMPFTL
jgi:hypothetical protein